MTLFTNKSFFFFLMIRRPPRSTLFPTRRSSDLTCMSRLSTAIPLKPCSAYWKMRPSKDQTGTEKSTPRSEEHTSELQSRQYLVCRLLLEKKKKHNHPFQLHLSLIS